MNITMGFWPSSPIMGCIHCDYNGAMHVFDGTKWCELIDVKDVKDDKECNYDKMLTYINNMWNIQ